MDKPLEIVVIEGTTRAKRQSIKAARLVRDVGEEIDEVNITFVDVADFFPLPGEGNDPESQDPKWLDINKKADAYFIVSPEYNHSFPGSLKMLLDNDLGNYTHKPVNIAGVSSGSIGGARMVEGLLSPLREMGFVVTFSDVYFPNVAELFQDKDRVEQQKKRIQEAYYELIWMAKALKWGRENLDKQK